MVYGRKRFVLYSPSDTVNLYSPPWHSISSTSAPSTIVRSKNCRARSPPLYAKARPIEVVLEAGDFLYIPTYWWHAVYGDDPCVLVLISGGPKRGLELSDARSTHSPVAAATITLCHVGFLSSESLRTTCRPEVIQAWAGGYEMTTLILRHAPPGKAPRRRVFVPSMASTASRESQHPSPSRDLRHARYWSWADGLGWT